MFSLTLGRSSRQKAEFFLKSFRLPSRIVTSRTVVELPSAETTFHEMVTTLPSIFFPGTRPHPTRTKLPSIPTARIPSTWCTTLRAKSEMIAHSWSEVVTQKQMLQPLSEIILLTTCILMFNSTEKWNQVSEIPKP